MTTDRVREAIARTIFGRAIGIEHWNNEFWREERDGCFATADAILALPAISGVREALEDLLNLYVELVNCGDCGFWDPEKVTEVIAARAALSALPEKDGETTISPLASPKCN